MSIEFFELAKSRIKKAEKKRNQKGAEKQDG
jgi:hypothetical protein